MSKYYNPRRKTNLYAPNTKEAYRLSRSKIDLFLNCPKCFYLDRRLGVGQPPGYPFTLNSAVDALLKKEFDIHRAKGQPHPLMKHYGIDAIPYRHDELEFWRDSLRGGIQYLHQPTNFFITGGVDDIWVNPKGELIIVDYKATAKNSAINLDAEWQDGYKRQMEIYQWLFRRNEYSVADTGYFVYVNGKTDKEAFDAKLEFDVHLLPYKGNDSWVEQAILDAYNCLIADKLPDSGPECDFCAYRLSASQIENKIEALKSNVKKYPKTKLF